MARCPECGSEAAAGDASCPRCGAPAVLLPVASPVERGAPGRLRTALALGIVAMLLVALLVALAVVLFVNVISAPADVATGYLKAINERDLDAAWGHLASEMKSEEGRGGFESKAGEFRGRIKSSDTSSIEVRDDTARVVVNLTGTDGSRETWDIILVKERGAWKIRHVTTVD